MYFSKRLFDVVLALFLLPIILPVILIVALIALCLQGRPIFYISERMQTHSKSFKLLKFRSMTSAASDAAASGGHKDALITPLGKKLRKYRLDETPQIFNILRGEMSFVGPRPPLRRYVDLRPDLYKRVLRSRPGLTGLATLIYNKTETRLLSRSESPEINERIYLERCVPAKAKIDLIYQNRRSACWDIKIIWATIAPGGK